MAPNGTLPQRAMSAVSSALRCPALTQLLKVAEGFQFSAEPPQGASRRALRRAAAMPAHSPADSYSSGAETVVVDDGRQRRTLQQLTTAFAPPTV